MPLTIARFGPLLGLLVAGCAAPDGAHQLNDISRQPELQQAIESYYDARANEGGMNCPGVRMDGVTSSRLVGEVNGVTQVEVTYYHRGVDDEDEALGSRCNGFATRIFSLTPTSEGGWSVIGMSGEQSS
jgi:hypothetical protein